MTIKEILSGLKQFPNARDPDSLAKTTHPEEDAAAYRDMPTDETPRGDTG